MITERKALEINIESCNFTIKRLQGKEKLNKKEKYKYKVELERLERFEHKLRVLDSLEGLGIKSW